MRRVHLGHVPGNGPSFKPVSDIGSLDGRVAATGSGWGVTDEPQCLHFLASRRISSAHSGHLTWVSLDGAKGAGPDDGANGADRADGATGAAASEGNRADQDHREQRAD